MTITSEEIALLDDDDIQDIQTHYNLALESEHGTGNHLLLMSCLSGHGFSTNGTDEAIEMADEIITSWNQLSRENYGESIYTH